jgi:SAM-dependent methyltransferase
MGFLDIANRNHLALGLEQSSSTVVSHADGQLVTGVSNGHDVVKLEYRIAAMNWRDQFRNSQGFLGSIAGWIMANRPSNRARNRWTIHLLQLKPTDHVLEIGCGPGVALYQAGLQTPKGQVIGLDHSDIMVKQAQRRNPGTTIIKRDLASIKGQLFDKIFSINVIQFVPDFFLFYRQIAQLLRKDGIVVTTYQPRHQHAKRQNAIDTGQKIASVMENIGFASITQLELALQPIPAITVIGCKSP